MEPGGRPGAEAIAEVPVRVVAHEREGVTVDFGHIRGGDQGR